MSIYLLILISFLFIQRVACICLLCYSETTIWFSQLFYPASVSPVLLLKFLLVASIVDILDDIIVLIQFFTIVDPPGHPYPKRYTFLTITCWIKKFTHFLHIVHSYFPKQLTSIILESTCLDRVRFSLWFVDSLINFKCTLSYWYVA